METSGDVELLCQAAAGLVREERIRYVEFRPVEKTLDFLPEFVRSEEFVLHRLDLKPSLQELEANLDKDSVRRRIQRADRENLTYKAGCGAEILKAFYELLLLTRRRHRVPAQPMSWFENLLACMGDSAKIHLMLKGQQPISAILTLHWGKKTYYKYGCSDPHFKNLGATPWLFWKMIKEAKAAGDSEVDLGRTDLENVGLRRFKEQWNAKAIPLSYWRYPGRAAKQGKTGRHWAGWILSVMPDSVLIWTGKILYRHFA